MRTGAPIAGDLEPFRQQLMDGHWFGGLPAALQDLIVRRSTFCTYRKGEVIVREGDATKGMFCVLKGRVRAVRNTKNDTEVLLDVGRVGYWFAVYGMLADAPSIGSVIADSAVVALNLPKSEFELIVNEEPRYYPHFAKLLIDQFALVFRYLGEVQGLAPEDWLLTRLKELVTTRQSEHVQNADISEIRVSQADLATMIGVSRQTLSGLLARLQERGLVEVAFRSIRIVG